MPANKPKTRPASGIPLPRQAGRVRPASSKQGRGLEHNQRKPLEWESEYGLAAKQKTEAKAALIFNIIDNQIGAHGMPQSDRVQEEDLGIQEIGDEESNDIFENFENKQQQEDGRHGDSGSLQHSMEQQRYA